MLEHARLPLPAPAPDPLARLPNATAPLAVELVRRYDVVVDASDNAPTRYLISDACCAAGRPLVSGAAIGTDGQLTVYCHGEDGARGGGRVGLEGKAPHAGPHRRAVLWRLRSLLPVQAARLARLPTSVPAPVLLQGPATAACSPRRRRRATARAAWTRACWASCPA